jgi:hypothetical protein
VSASEAAEGGFTQDDVKVERRLDARSPASFCSDSLF